MKKNSLSTVFVNDVNSFLAKPLTGQSLERVRLDAVCQRRQQIFKDLYENRENRENTRNARTCTFPTRPDSHIRIGKTVDTVDKVGLSLERVGFSASTESVDKNRGTFS